MKYYYCNDCGNIFLQDAARELWDSDGRVTKYYDACPDCRSTEIEEAGVCKICGKAIEPSEDYCDDCNRAVYKIWERAVCEVIDLCEDSDYCDAEDRFKEYLDDTGVI